jgi:peptide methionine sulfoxide reductase msrA/msrB
MKSRNLQYGLLAIGLIVVLIIAVGRAPRSEDTKGDTMTFNKLTPEEERVIVRKGTETAFTGKYYQHHDSGTYTCRRCNAPLFKSTDKFESGCGWPSFDDAIPGAVKQQVDSDGHRTEILCAKCGGHLGHVFLGEGFTPRDTRHCVNSVSLDFIAAETAQTDTAYFAGGCFWGVEYYLEKAEGVLSVRSGYMGGHLDNPSYEQVCDKSTGHAEAVEVTFDPSKISYEELTKLFFEIHDPTQIDRQGPDVGEQYRSVVFYTDDSQKQTAEKLIGILKGKGFKIATEVARADTFWSAEDYHQDYYTRTGKYPYCHAYEKRF